MSNCNHRGACNCSSQEIEALLCQLLDESLSPQQRAAVQARIAECNVCMERLETEQIVRRLVRTCDKATHAPETLRQRITVQIRSIRYR